MLTLRIRDRESVTSWKGTMPDFNLKTNTPPATPLYFGLGPLISWVIEKVVLPGPTSSTGLSEFEGGDPQARWERIQEGARIRALSDDEWRAELRSRQSWTGEDVEPMWKRDP